MIRLLRLTSFLATGLGLVIGCLGFLFLFAAAQIEDLLIRRAQAARDAALDSECR